MTVTLVYDDTVDVPSQIASITGIERFGSLIYRKKPLHRWVLDCAAQAGFRDVVHLTRPADVKALHEQLGQLPGDVRVLYVPSSLVFRSWDSCRVFFQKVRFSRSNLVLAIEGGGGGESGGDTTAILLAEVRLMRRAVQSGQVVVNREFLVDHADSLVPLDNTVGAQLIADQPSFLDFLTSNFDVRYFNAILSEGMTIRKASSDRVKIRREYTYYNLLPEAMQRFFVQPFDLVDQGDRAHYTMERLNVPDMAVQWMHNGLSATDFERFLDRVLGFVQSRAERAATTAEVARLRDELYLDKLDARMDRLRSTPLFPFLDALVRHTTGSDGVDEVVSRYKSLYARQRGRVPSDRLCIGHGDLCLSNILYDKRTLLLKLIDPRGAERVEELYTDPYYDLAKLSHSVLGLYDFLNNGLFEIGLDTDLKVAVRIDGPDRSIFQQTFRDRVEAAGFSISGIRLFEASLFLSMLPLHIDVPQKVLAFVLNAIAILDDLDDRKHGGGYAR